tara:strand:- start:216 stop:734 length:519 start_codon:yes stop_codon:yes gene_type:complete
MSLIKMENHVHPIATITKTSGISGDVRLRPLSRFFEDYIQKKDLSLGFSADASDKIQLELVKGIGKKRRFKFEGVNSLSDAEKIVGQTIFIEALKSDRINFIGKGLIGFDVILETGDFIGLLKDVMWLPSNDAYIIKNGDKEYLIPVIPEVVKSVDYGNGVIIITPMDGLLD